MKLNNLVVKRLQLQYHFVKYIINMSNVWFVIKVID